MNHPDPGSCMVGLYNWGHQTTSLLGDSTPKKPVAATLDHCTAHAWNSNALGFQVGDEFGPSIEAQPLESNDARVGRGRETTSLVAAPSGFGHRVFFFFFFFFFFFLFFRSRLQER